MFRLFCSFSVLVFSAFCRVQGYVVHFFFLMIRRPPRSTQGVSSAASDVYKRQDSSSGRAKSLIGSLARAFGAVFPIYTTPSFGNLLDVVRPYLFISKTFPKTLRGPSFTSNCNFFPETFVASIFNSGITFSSILISSFSSICSSRGFSSIFFSSFSFCFIDR
eukprot:TRINITY_DN14791_c0_g2_i3.p2 TRINITY_DN14791_c0_g2~~TRINITY_DN14791_c0_g2_i3.p2  ORF type:complete len:163 (-),score=18.83 TRINITY_DN14791_c0_g2_i3:442-930(-)